MVMIRPESSASAATLVTLLACAGCVCVLGCAAPPPPAPSGKVSPPQESANSIPDSPLSGTLRGAPFKLANARYYVDTRRGYEHIEVQLNAASAGEPCGPLVSKDDPTVFLRRKGSEHPAPGEVRLEPKTPGPWEVHYQAREHERWIGNGYAAALLVLKEVRSDGALEADLSVCFADGLKSCVSGSINATRCKIPIDSPVRGTEVAGESAESYILRTRNTPRPSAPEQVSPDGGAPASAPVAPPSTSASAAPAPAPSHGSSH
jgi:hypothetical protein